MSSFSMLPSHISGKLVAFSRIADIILLRYLLHWLWWECHRCTLNRAYRYVTRTSVWASGVNTWLCWIYLHHGCRTGRHNKMFIYLTSVFIFYVKWRLVLQCQMEHFTHNGKAFMHKYIAKHIGHLSDTLNQLSCVYCICMHLSN